MIEDWLEARLPLTISRIHHWPVDSVDLAIESANMRRAGRTSSGTSNTTPSYVLINVIGAYCLSIMIGECK